jgi:hypothetical protein
MGRGWGVGVGVTVLQIEHLTDAGCMGPVPANQLATTKKEFPIEGQSLPLGTRPFTLRAWAKPPKNRGLEIH